MGGEHLQCCYREQVAFALYSKFREPKLFRMAASGDWDLIPERCRTHPKEAGFIHRYAPNDTALHRILRGKTCDVSVRSELDEASMASIDEMKLAAVRALLFANRHAAAQADALGRTPLHLACTNLDTCGEAVALMIMEANPRAASVRDLEQRTPLHFLVARNEVIPVDLLTLVIDQYPEALMIADKMGDTPQSLVEARREEIQNFETILQTLEMRMQQHLEEKNSGRRVSTTSVL